MKSDLKFIILFSVALGVSISIQYILASWSVPTAVPPGGNVLTPVYIGSSTESRAAVAGGLAIGNSLYVYGTSTLTGNVGVGTTSLAAKLNIFDGSSGPIMSLSGLETNYRGLKIADLGGNENWFAGADSGGNFVFRNSGNSNFLSIYDSGLIVTPKYSNRVPAALPLFRWLPIKAIATYNTTYAKNLASDGTNIWVTSYAPANSVIRLAPNGTVTTFAGTGAGPWGIASDGTNMWTANYSGNSVTKISPSGTMTTYSGTGANPMSIAFDGVNMWTCNYTANSVTKITPTGAMTTYSGTGLNPQEIAFDGTNMWTANYGTNSVTKITPTGAMTTYSGTGKNPFGIAFDGTNMWVSGNSPYGVTKISPTGTMTIYSGLASQPNGMAFDGTNMWTLDPFNSSIVRISPSGVMTSYSGTGVNPQNLIYSKDYIWVANTGAGTVTKFLVNTK